MIFSEQFDPSQHSRQAQVSDHMDVGAQIVMRLKRGNCKNKFILTREFEQIFEQKKVNPADIEN